MTIIRCALHPRCISQISAVCRPYSSITKLRDGNLETFRREAFAPALPALLPKGQFLGLPARKKWFIHSEASSYEASLNYSYLDAFGTAVVPLELTDLAEGAPATGCDTSFQRAEIPLHVFLEWTKLASKDTAARLYLAQASLATLPEALTNDLPTPDIVVKAGTGDLYDTNVWLGIAPTYTPLHRDPNPNLFVQLAGHKIVRMLSPRAGDKVFARVQRAMGKSGSAAFRGEEMMKGEEKQMLEAEIWDDPRHSDDEDCEAYEAHVMGGDGLFIPKGWWHSIKGVDNGILASVNWWFR